MDIILTNNAITFPQTLYDGNIFRYRLEQDGSIRNIYSDGTLPAGVKGGQAWRFVSGEAVYPLMEIISAPRRIGDVRSWPVRMDWPD